MDDVIKSPKEINQIMDKIVEEIAPPAFIYAVGPMNFGLYNFNAGAIYFIAVYLDDYEKETIYKDIVLDDNRVICVTIAMMSYDDWKEYGEYTYNNYEIFTAYGKYELFWTNFVRWDEKINDEFCHFMQSNEEKLLENKQTLRCCIRKYVILSQKSPLFFTKEQADEATRSLYKINNLLTISDNTKIFEIFNKIKSSDYGRNISNTFDNLSPDDYKMREIVDLQCSREKIEKIKEETIIWDRVAEHYGKMCEIYGKDHIMAVLPFGSMNYGLFRKGKSDVDTKMIYVPSFEEALLDKPIIKTHTILTEDGQKEFCTVKDIRLMKDMWLKGGFNFLEILFTKYGYINPKYKDNWQFLQVNRNKLINGVKNKCLKSTSREIREHLKKAMIIKDEYSLKLDYVKHCTRADYLLGFLTNFSKGKSFEKAMIPFNADWIMEARDDVEKRIALYDLLCLTHMIKRNEMYDLEINQEQDEFQEEQYKRAEKMLREWCIDVINHAR